MRLTVQKGMEVIRAIGLHGLPIQLALHLARTFQYQSSEDSSRSKHKNLTSPLAERASHYWRVAVDMLEKLKQ